jgi:gluconate 2-dehydrogenase alpha chain
MATEKTDVVIVGVGAAGGVLAAELGKAGMKVIGLERGPRLKTSDFQLDELRYFQRQDLRPDMQRQPVTWRPNTEASAQRMPFLNNGNQAGGGTVHYGAVSWRCTKTISGRARTPLRAMAPAQSQRIPRSPTGR